ncbi:MAG: glycosyltransferase family A protein [Acidimicrobiales bacterium]|jgi:glycosyltransferase involved in cell wall biosynthesis
MAVLMGGEMRRDTSQPTDAPSVSVVIPSYRGGRLLREAVSSVQSQTLQNLEIVIVLDGCEDDLSDLEQNDQRINLIRQHRRGASIARNVGIAQARSELIAFLDDDDRMLPERLTRQLEAMADSSVGLCHTECSVIDEDGRPMAFGDPLAGRSAVSDATGETGREPGEQYRAFLRGDEGLALSSVVVRKSLIQELGGFNPLLLSGEDLDLVFRIARESKVSFLPDVLTEYRRHRGNTWSEASTTRELKLVLMQHVVVAQAHGDAEDLRAARAGLANLMSGRAIFAMHRAYEARSRHDYLGASLAFGQALVSSPRGSSRAAWRLVQKNLLGGPSIAAFLRSRVRPRGEPRSS